MVQHHFLKRHLSQKQTNMCLKATHIYPPHRPRLGEQAALWLLCGYSCRDSQGCRSWSLSWGLLTGQLCLCHFYRSTTSLRPKIKSSKLNIQTRYICRAWHLHCWRRDLNKKKRIWVKEGRCMGQFDYLQCVFLLRYSKNRFQFNCRNKIFWVKKEKRLVKTLMWTGISKKDCIPIYIICVCIKKKKYYQLL